MKKENLNFFHEYGVEPDSRIIYLGSAGEHDGEESGVDYKMAAMAIKNILFLDNNGESPMTLILNSPGGDVYHGYAIYDAIRQCKNYVRIVGMGSIMSMGSVIFQAGDERILTPNTTMMLHYGNFAIAGHPKDVSLWAQAETKDMRRLEDLYLEKIRDVKPKYSRAALQAKIRNDCILNAEEAVEMGLATRISENQ